MVFQSSKEDNKEENKEEIRKEEKRNPIKEFNKEQIIAENEGISDKFPNSFNKIKHINQDFPNSIKFKPKIREKISASNIDNPILTKKEESILRKKNSSSDMLNYNESKSRFTIQKKFKKEIMNNTKSKICDLFSENKKKKKKGKKRMKFKKKFLDVVEIESYKDYNVMVCFSDLELIESKKNDKCLCKKYCNIF